jgi:hypothetical protein
MLEVSIFPLSTIFLLYFGTVPTVWFCFFHFIIFVFTSLKFDKSACAPELYMNEARYHLAMYHDSNLKIKFQCKSIRKLSDTTRTDITKKHVYLC